MVGALVSIPVANMKTGAVIGLPTSRRSLALPRGLSGHRLNVTRKDGFRLRQLPSGAWTVLRRRMGETARIARDAEQIQELRSSARHERLSQDADDAQRLEGHGQNRRHADRILFSQDPRFL